MIITLTRCSDILSAAQNLGGTPPSELAATVDAFGKLETELRKADPVAIVTDALNKGDAITANVAAKAAQAQAVAANAAEVERRVENALAQRFRDQILDQPGADLIDSLRSKFDAATNAMTALPYPVNATAESLLELDDPTAAIDAWKSVAPHRKFLDGLAALVYRTSVDIAVITADGGATAVSTTLAPLVTASWFTDTPIRFPEQLETFKHAYQTADPAGRWHALAGALTLNTPARAQQIFAASYPNFTHGIGPMPSLRVGEGG